MLISPSTAAHNPRSWFHRFEGPTWLLAAGLYTVWLLLVLFHALLPWWLLAPAGAYVTALHFSLQHEAIHGWRSCPAWLRNALVWPPIGLWLPFFVYRRSHSIHHRNPNLTYPNRDTESVYHRRQDWAHYSRAYKTLLTINQTFFGRLLIGPPIRIYKLLARDLSPLLRRDFRDLPIWAAHTAGVAGILWFVTGVGGMPAWQYIVFFAYGGMVLSWIRPFLEHRWGDRPYERVASIESNWFFGLLFLWNNLHIVHHRHPTMPWYEIPGFYREHRANLLAVNGHYVYNGYFDLVRRYSFKPAFIPVHPDT